MIVTRFAPSPTGFIHLGNARILLFNYFFSYKRNGRYLIRIEDTDCHRSKHIFYQLLLHNLNWIKIKFNFDFAFQSNRNNIYFTYFNFLELFNYAYFCICEKKKYHKFIKNKGKRCNCKFNNILNYQWIFKYYSVLKLNVKLIEKIGFYDIVRGRQFKFFNCLKDFIIRKSNGCVSFLLANVIDDAQMGISHVIRGEDHITNTAKQLIILKYLRLKPPVYIHLSMIFNEKKKILSKRIDSNSLQYLMLEGFVSLGIINYLARIGLNYNLDKLLEHSKLIQCFRITKIF